MNEKIVKDAIEGTAVVQRNYDLSKKIPDHHLETLIYAAANSPSKQSEEHYSVRVFTEPNKIRQIYTDCTKLFGLAKDEDDFKEMYKEVNGVFQQNEELSITNSQVWANVLFVFIERIGETRGGSSWIAENESKLKNQGNTHRTPRNRWGNARDILWDQVRYSMGISIGQLILTANMLGYKTGINSGFYYDRLQYYLNEGKEINEDHYLGNDGKNEAKMMIGIGFPQEGVDSRMHPEVLNKDVREKFRTGPDQENWLFPTFEKTCHVELDGTEYKI